MPLIPCPECQKQISAAAIACPQCGHPLKRYYWPFGYLDEREVKARSSRSAIVLVILLGGAFALNFFLFRESKRSLPTPEPPMAPPVEAGK